MDNLDIKFSHENFKKTLVDNRPVETVTIPKDFLEEVFKQIAEDALKEQAKK